jgi:hypothetical protein
MHIRVRADGEMDTHTEGERDGEGDGERDGQRHRQRHELMTSWLLEFLQNV